MKLTLKTILAKLTIPSIIVIVFIVLLCGLCLAEDKNVSNVNLGIMDYYFNDVNVNDAKVAMNEWAAELGKEYKKKTGITMNYNITYYNSINDLMNLVKSNKLDMVVFSPVDYLQYDLKKYVDPFMIDKADERLTKVFLVSKSQNITNLSDLKSKKITVEAGIEGIFSLYWLNMLAQQNGIDDYSHFFSPIDVSKNNRRIIMELFFGQTDACITSLFNFKTNSEINPQIKDNIKILYSIDKILNSMTSIRKGSKAIDTNVITEIAMNKNSNMTMKSMMALFKRGTVVPFNKELLIQIEELYKYNKNEIKIKNTK